MMSQRLKIDSLNDHKNSLLTDGLLFLYSFTLEKIIYLYFKGI